MGRLFHQTCYRLRRLASTAVGALLRKPVLRLQGMAIGSGTVLESFSVNWPHTVSIGARCVLEPGIAVKFDGIWTPVRAVVIGDEVFIGRNTEFNIRQRIEIGSQALIGSGCKFIDHGHGMRPGMMMGPQAPSVAPIVVGRGVWLGTNCVVLEGVSIGEGAVIGAGAVVNRSVPANEIWGGVPARRLGSRADGAGARVEVAAP